MIGGLWTRLKLLLAPTVSPRHIKLGKRGELAARRYLKSKGLKFLTANYRTPRGEIDLIFRDGNCLVFIEVRTRSSEKYGRPSESIDADKKRRFGLAALHYLRRAGCPNVPVRFDVVEVILDKNGEPTIRHLPNAFGLSPPFRYG
ncbi:MAG: YraN family protein [Verrucomicrobiae bacterium]|nr:YraN family protein [Verrucomicrobiae bacterium]